MLDLGINPRFPPGLCLYKRISENDQEAFELTIAEATFLQRHWRPSVFSITGIVSSSITNTPGV